MDALKEEGPQETGRVGFEQLTGPVFICVLLIVEIREPLGSAFKSCPIPTGEQELYFFWTVGQHFKYRLLWLALSGVSVTLECLCQHLGRYKGLNNVRVCSAHALCLIGTSWWGMEYDQVARGKLVCSFPQLL